MGARRLAQSPQFFFKQKNLFFFFFKKKNLFIRLCRVLVVACGLSYSAARGILVAQPKMEPTTPALQGRFLTIGQPGKPQAPLFFRGPRRPGPGPAENSQGRMFGPDGAAQGFTSSLKTNSPTSQATGIRGLRPLHVQLNSFSQTQPPL